MQRPRALAALAALALATGAGCAPELGQSGADINHGQGQDDGGNVASDNGEANGLRCPPGSRFLYWAATCAGANAATPAAVTTGAPGDVVALGGVNSALLPCARAAVCGPAHPATLLFSDEPESPRQDGVLYEDTVGHGTYRVYVYHTNGGTTRRSFAVVAENVSDEDATVTVGANGLAGPSTSFVFTGKRTLSRYFAPATDSVLTLAPGQRAVVNPALAAISVAPGNLVNNVTDVAVEGHVRLSVVTYPAGGDPLAAAATLSVIPSTHVHDRGTFPGAERWIVVQSPYDSAGPQRVRLGTGDTDPPLVGTDATSGAAATLRGNFGVTYRFLVPSARTTTLGLVSRGGAWGGALTSDGAAPLELPRVATTVNLNTQAIVLARASAGELIDFTMATAGGASLPVDVVFFASP